MDLHRHKNAVFDRSGRRARTRRRSIARLLVPMAMSAAVMMSGCGTTKSFEATEQLLLSEAVDQSIAAIDFRPMTGHKVFLDTRYINQVKTQGFVNADYVISSLRQQITGAGCLLQDSAEQADIVIEARVGTLGADGFQVTYGVPSSSALASAAQVLPTAPPIPVIPEMSIARRESREGAAKIAAFAYDRVTREALWQSGIARTTTTSRDTWLMGIGPIQTGSIRRRTRLIGSGLEFGQTTIEGGTPLSLYDRPPVNYAAQVRFEDGMPIVGPRVAQPGMLTGPAEEIATPDPASVDQAAAEQAAAEQTATEQAATEQAATE